MIFIICSTYISLFYLRRGSRQNAPLWNLFIEWNSKTSSSVFLYFNRTSPVQIGILNYVIWSFKRETFNVGTYGTFVKWSQSYIFPLSMVLWKSFIVKKSRKIWLILIPCDFSALEWVLTNPSLSSDVPVKSEQN